ncbi:MAG: hypothetical protein VKK63_00245 [Synechococcus sp.]|nr:hypothetical protein [Synechococcus sp.]
MEAPKETPTYVHASGKVLPVNELAPIVNPLNDSQDNIAEAKVVNTKDAAPADKKKRVKKS